MPAGQRGELRIGLTISGAIALGAFEGGALAALLTGVQEVNSRRGERDSLRVDVIAGASAGSMTGLLAARTLLAGLDPLKVMREAWVQMPQLGALEGHMDAPLAVDGMLELADRLLGSSGRRPRQAHPVSVHMALGSLHRLDYEIGRIAGPPVRAGTYLDWHEVRLGPRTGQTAYRDAMHAALASGAHALAFRPRRLERTAPAVRRRYRANHVANPPDRAWYTDGGTIDNQPLGRALDLAQAADIGAEGIGSGARLHLLIDPDPPSPAPPDDRWTADESPRWTTTGARVLTLLRSQHLYDDLERLETTNARISWTNTLAHALTELLEDPDPRRAKAGLRSVISAIRTQQRDLLADADVADTRAAPDSEIGRLVSEALGMATGYGQKRYIAIAVVSPLLLPDVADGAKTPRDLLSGAFLGHFGGFLAQELRENDFALGYRCMVEWMQGPNGLRVSGLAGDPASAAIAAAQARQPEWNPGLAGATLHSRGVLEKIEIAKVAGRAMLIASNDVAHDGL